MGGFDVCRLQAARASWCRYLLIARRSVLAEPSFAARLTRRAWEIAPMPHRRLHVPQRGCRGRLSPLLAVIRFISAPKRLLIDEVGDGQWDITF
jgi:hypothetical protein